MIDVCLLGTGGTLSLPERFLSSLLVRFGGRLILIDCARAPRSGPASAGSASLKDIGTILITHFHADHIAGLPGLLLTIGNSGRNDEPVTISQAANIQPRRRLAASSPSALAVPRPLQGTARRWARNRVDRRPEARLHGRSRHGLPFRIDSTCRAPAFQPPERPRRSVCPCSNGSCCNAARQSSSTAAWCSPRSVPRPAANRPIARLPDRQPPTRSLVEFHSDEDLPFARPPTATRLITLGALENKHMTFAESAARAARALWFTHFTPPCRIPIIFGARPRRCFQASSSGTSICRRR